MKDQYTIILLLFIFSGPLIFILAFTENQTFVSVILPVYDTLITSITGISLMLIGAVILLIRRYQLNKHTYGGASLSEDKQQNLLTSGMYKFVRHPLYTGGLIMTIGLQLAFRSIFMFVIHVLLYFIIFRNRMIREEEVLQSKFGKEYENYMKRTNRLLPYIY